jgi:protoporphyrin/coproporphyrin ferrochelatase
MNISNPQAEAFARALPPGHPPVNFGKIGILLINLGTPDATSYWPMRAYLKEFLSDRRVIEVNPLIWWPLLNLVILSTRPKRSGHAYEQIWNKELNESPLRTFTRAQSEKVAKHFSSAPSVVVDWAMRYGKPSIPDKLRALQDEGCERILLFPLYPQYSASTTGTALDKAYETFQTMRWQPAIRTAPPFHDERAYIDAIAQSIIDFTHRLSWKPDRILISFHGLPREYLDKGDPYHCHCQKTLRLLRYKLGMDENMLQLVFQSRFGKAEWLKPYAQETVEELPKQGVKNLLMISPGFISDCVETLEELAIGLKETFQENGGENFAVVPCLNDSDPAIDMLVKLIGKELKGWLDTEGAMRAGQKSAAPR